MLHQEIVVESDYTILVWYDGLSWGQYFLKIYPVDFLFLIDYISRSRLFPLRFEARETRLDFSETFSRRFSFGMVSRPTPLRVPECGNVQSPLQHRGRKSCSYVVSGCDSQYCSASLVAIQGLNRSSKTGLSKLPAKAVEGLFEILDVTI